MMRRATLEDIPDLVDMGRKFHAAKQNLYPFVSDDTIAFFAGVIESGAVFRSDSGFIAGTAAGAPSNQSYKTAYELFWWSESRGEGRRLRQAFEEWAQSVGCKDVVFSHPEDERIVNKMLIRAGYVPQTRMLRRQICV